MGDTKITLLLQVLSELEVARREIAALREAQQAAEGCSTPPAEADRLSAAQVCYISLLHVDVSLKMHRYREKWHETGIRNSGPLGPLVTGAAIEQQHLLIFCDGHSLLRMAALHRFEGVIICPQYLLASASARFSCNQSLF